MTDPVWRLKNDLLKEIAKKRALDPVWRLRYRLSNLRLDTKSVWQRARRGWADVDRWNLHEWLAEKLSAMLFSMIYDGYGYPMDRATYEEWQAELYHAALTLNNWKRAINEDCDLDFPYDQIREDYDLAQAEVEKTFVWLGKNLNNLWD